MEHLRVSLKCNSLLPKVRHFVNSYWVSCFPVPWQVSPRWSPCTGQRRAWKAVREGLDNGRKNPIMAGWFTKTFRTSGRTYPSLSASAGSKSFNSLCTHLNHTCADKGIFWPFCLANLFQYNGISIRCFRPIPFKGDFFTGGKQYFLDCFLGHLANLATKLYLPQNLSFTHAFGVANTLAACLGPFTGTTLGHEDLCSLLFPVLIVMHRVLFVHPTVQTVLRGQSETVSLLTTGFPY